MEQSSSHHKMDKKECSSKQISLISASCLRNRTASYLLTTLQEFSKILWSGKKQYYGPLPDIQTVVSALRAIELDKIVELGQNYN